MSDGATGRGPVEAIACPACGQQNPAGFRLCGMCGEPLAPRASERRKLATLLFCDMSGSTAMGERVDPESVRVAMSRYFQTMRDAIERHGGTVEKFIGDAVVAIFGVPVAHEDDALRAVRTAWEMQTRLVDLNAELLERVGTTIALRIGVNTGEVVSGDASARESVVTGDPVNTAARLEQAANPGEILLGELTWTLVRELVDAEPVAPIQAKGKAEPVPAYRLLGVSAGDAPRAGRSETALVGRAVELTALRGAWEAATAGRCGQVATVVGEPGVGKSRLAREFAQSLGTARILSGRCLSYGEGITWWPVSQIVREAVAIRDDHTPAEARSQIENTLPDDARAGLVAAVLAQVLGLGDGAATVDEIGWAVRRLLSGLARERPTLVVLDDVQWAEPVIHDLVDSLTTLHEPLLCLCLARPELIELRTDVDALRLDPLGAREASEHASLLVEGAGLAAADATRVLAAAGGNPLFAEELVAMITENPDATMPPSLAALISARLDLLPDTERGALDCGAVEGEVFHEGAVEDLAARPVDAELTSLGARGFVRPTRSSFSDDAAFRFRHLLIRDVTYETTAKRRRAELHERFASWLERRAGQRLAELEEVVGYHLEQAYRLLGELGPVDRPDLTRRAAERLGSAGRRAASRGDVRAAGSLLGRAASFVPIEDEVGSELRLELAIVRAKQADPTARDVLSELAAEARRRDDDRLATLVELERRTLDFFYARLGATELLESARAAAAVLDAATDDRWQAHVLTRTMLPLVQLDRLREAVVTGRRAVDLARRAGARSVEVEALEWLHVAMMGGDTSQATVDELTRELLDDPELGPSVEWFVLLTRGLALGGAGRADEAREYVRQGKASALELGLVANAACTSMQLAQAELLSLEPRDAEPELRAAIEVLTELGAENMLASVMAYLALVLSSRGEMDEAALVADRAVERAALDDFEVRLMALGIVRSRVLSARGDHAAAIEAARSAVPPSTEDGQVFMAAFAHLAHGEALRAAGRVTEARVAFEAALALHETKGNVVSAHHLRRSIAALGTG